jgi:amino acid transporter
VDKRIDDLKYARMGFNATWSMAVGGMVGGGIFSVLGVVILVAGQWAWLSFLLAGLIALATAYSYSQLARKFGESGGAFTFLRKINHEGFAGSLAWVLILGYILTISVYGYTFGHYIAHSLSIGAWFPRFSALAVIMTLTWINLRGVADSSLVEIVTVWGKLAVLLGLAAFGLAKWAPAELSTGIVSKDWTAALVGGASVFMAYEGFQLLTYDYDEIKDADRTVPRASISAVISVIAIYILVALGATMLVGAGAIVQQKEVALAEAGRHAFGTPGLILVTVAAAFSTASAINATLFATARLMEDVAEHKDLPHLLSHENRKHVPTFAVIFIGAFGALLASIGSLGTLVEVASLTFLFTFCVVNVLALHEGVRHRWVSMLGAAGAGLAVVLSIWRLIHISPYVVILIALIILIILIGRPMVLKRL